VVESDGRYSDWSGRVGGEEVDELIAGEEGRDKRERGQIEAKGSRDWNAEERRLTNGAIDRDNP